VYPISLNISGKLCVVVGGGQVAERKVLSLLKAHALVRIISPQLTERLAEVMTEQSAKKTVQWWKRGYQTGDLDGALLAFAATDDHKVQGVVVADAQQAGILVNVIDAPEKCNFQVPALVRRGDLSIAVSTNGASPALAAKVRQELDRRYGDEYAVVLRLMSLLRKKICSIPTINCAERKRVFQNILHEDILHWIRTEQWDRLVQHLETVLGPGIDFDLTELTAQEIKET
jgi:precorrin-2 dehydrogenase/sirohydrochlorin ferrochelatase